jgi:cytochrome c-type biogenesis protein
MQDVLLIIAFTAGLLSFLSPCVLPLVPIYLANLAGASALEVNTRVRRSTFLHSLLFVAGFSIVFIALGASASVLGSTIGLGLPFLIVGAVLGPATAYLKRLRRFSAITSTVSGALLIGVRAVIFSNSL